MGKQILLDVRLFAGSADLSGWTNKLEVVESAEAKDTTNFRSGGAKTVLAGITSTELDGEGQWEAGDPSFVDDATWADRREVVPWSFAPNSDSDLTVGGLIYFTKALRTKSTLWGSLGDVAGWTAKAAGSLPLVRGVVAHPSGTARTVTGVGTGVNLGAVPVGSRLYSNLHILSVAGTATPSIAVKVQSDSANTFSSPVDALTFTTATTRGGQAVRSGKTGMTDTWYRMSWTITGTTPSFLFLATLGIER